MKITRFVCLILALVILTGCTQTPHSPTEPSTAETEVPTTEEASEAATSSTEESECTSEPPATETMPGQQEKADSVNDVPSQAEQAGEKGDKETSPTEKTADEKTPSTEHPATEPPSAKDTQPEEAETEPPASLPPETTPVETEAPATESTEPPATEEPTVTEITYEYKRLVASYAAQYINQYRGTPCTVLPGMSQVAQYRASQLSYNYSHSTSDKRAALAAFEYGRYIDATEFGDDASNSYWEADSAEAICAGFYGTDPETMGKKIADMIRNSSGHWSYISSSEYCYIGVGVEYREGSQYGWYCCVMVGSVDYG